MKYSLLHSRPLCHHTTLLLTNRSVDDGDGDGDGGDDDDDDDDDTSEHKEDAEAGMWVL